jgi:hypothetical protein
MLFVLFAPEGKKREHFICLFSDGILVNIFLRRNSLQQFIYLFWDGILFNILFICFETEFSSTFYLFFETEFSWQFHYSLWLVDWRNHCAKWSWKLVKICKDVSKLLMDCKGRLYTWHTIMIYVALLLLKINCINFEK